MLPAESGTLPHRPWTPMSLVNGRHRKRSAAGGWSEAEVCAEELPLRGGLRSECPGESPCGSIGKKLLLLLIFITFNENLSKYFSYE